MTNTTLEKWEEKTLGEVCEILDSRRKPITKKDRISGVYPYYGATGILDYVSGWIFDEGLVLLGEDGAKWTSGEQSAFKISGKTWVNNHAHVLRPNKDKISDIYLIYNLNFQNLMPYITGTTVPKLNQEKMRSISIPLPPLPEQERIVAKLDEAFEAIDKVKANAEQNLNNAKELFESTLNKAFTENTDGWEEKTLKEVCKKISAGGDKPENFSKEITENCEVPIYSNGIENDGLYGYTDVPAVTEEAITISARGTIGFVCKRIKPYYPIVRLISAIPNDHINIDFMAYALKFMVPTGNGSSIPQLTVPMLKDKKIKYPSLPEQQKIVEKLDVLQEQTKQLEAIYTQKIKECDELKQSILQKAFRGEL